MADLTLPFEQERLYAPHDNAAARQLRKAVSPELAKVCRQNRFVEEYLLSLPLEEIGVPTYYPEPSRRLRDLEVKNLIYPTHGGLFVHIYPNLEAQRDYYIPIEPNLTLQLDPYIEELEMRLLDWTEEIGMAETDEAKTEALSRAMDSIVSTNGRGGKVNTIQVTPREMEGIRYQILKEKVGFGLLAPLLNDPYIEDISCSGTGPIFLEHKIFQSVVCAISFEEMDDLDEFVIWMGEWIKRPVTVRNPIVDAVLPDGSRINIVYGTDISKRGSNFTIRKFNETPLSVLELIEFNTLSYMMASYLSFMLEEGLNLFVAGATASGKTTTMNAITTFIRPEAKIVSIEDTPELQVPHGNWIREQTRGGKDGGGASVGMFDLLKAALRQRPDRIIIGEIRGEEGAIAFQAMQSGHGVMSTFHAGTVAKLIQRLTGAPISIPKSYVDSLDICLIQAAVQAPGGGKARRVTSINEIVGYDALTSSFSFIETFSWNPATDEHEFPGYMNSIILEERIAPLRGLPPFKRKAIYTELKRRARIFERIHKDKGVEDFYEFFQVMSQAYKQGLL